MSASTKNLLALSESILAETTSVKEAGPVGVDPIVDDGLKGVVVPNAFVENAINFAKRLDEGSTATYEESPVQYMNEAKIVETKLVSLVERLKSLIIEARELLKEQTFSGMIAPGVQKKMKMVRPPNSKRRKKG